MRVNLNDPASIRAWLAVHPKNIGQLRGLWKLMPQFRQAIEEATR